MTSRARARCWNKERTRLFDDGRPKGRRRRANDAFEASLGRRLVQSRGPRVKEDEERKMQRERRRERLKASERRRKKLKARTRDLSPSRPDASFRLDWCGRQNVETRQWLFSGLTSDPHITPLRLHLKGQQRKTSTVCSSCSFFPPRTSTFDCTSFDDFNFFFVTLDSPSDRYTLHKAKKSLQPQRCISSPPPPWSPPPSSPVLKPRAPRPSPPPVRPPSSPPFSSWRGTLTLTIAHCSLARRVPARSVSPSTSSPRKAEPWETWAMEGLDTDRLPPRAGSPSRAAPPPTSSPSSPVYVLTLASDGAFAVVDLATRARACALVLMTRVFATTGTTRLGPARDSARPGLGRLGDVRYLSSVPSSQKRRLTCRQLERRHRRRHRHHRPSVRLPRALAPSPRQTGADIVPGRAHTAATRPARSTTRSKSPSWPAPATPALAPTPAPRVPPRAPPPPREPSLPFAIH